MNLCSFTLLFSIQRLKPLHLAQRVITASHIEESGGFLHLNYSYTDLIQYVLFWSSAFINSN